MPYSLWTFVTSQAPPEPRFWRQREAEGFRGLVDPRFCQRSVGGFFVFRCALKNTGDSGDSGARSVVFVVVVVFLEGVFLVVLGEFLLVNLFVGGVWRGMSHDPLESYDLFSCVTHLYQCTKCLYILV